MLTSDRSKQTEPALRIMYVVGGNGQWLAMRWIDHCLIMSDYLPSGISTASIANSALDLVIIQDSWPRLTCREAAWGKHYQHSQRIVYMIYYCSRLGDGRRQSLM